MGLIREGIDCVRVYELPVGIWADGKVAAGPRVCLVKWRSKWLDKVHQVYVNGRFAGATIDCQQRQMVVATPNCSERVVRVEIFALGISEADVDFSEELQQSNERNGRVKLSLLRSQRLASGARFNVYYDKGTGEIDYTNPIGEGDIWTSWQDKAGFGLAKFGEGDFGYEWAAGVGFGMGGFGAGEFGADADVIEWLSPILERGVYKFAVKVIDESGNESAASETEEVTVIPSARPVSEMNLLSFDEATNTLILEISDK